MNSPFSTALEPDGAIALLPGDTFLRVQDLPGSPASAKAAASRASRAGIITRVRPGLYFKSGQTPDGPSRPTPDAIAREVIGVEGVGPAGPSAAWALGLRRRAPAEPEFAILGRKPAGLAGVRIHQRTNACRRNLAYLEIALLEVLRNPGSLIEGTWADLVAAIRTATADGMIDLTRVQSAVSHEGAPPVRTALARLLVDLGCDLPGTPQF